MRLIITISVSLIFSSLCSAQTTWYVPDDFPAGIQAALSDSSVANGDTLIVRPGTYVENIDFLGKAITLKSELGAASTIIDGNQITGVVRFAGSEGLDSVLDGFTIRNGYAHSPTWGGGGILCRQSSPTLINNRILNNKADKGAGVYISGGAPVLKNNRISMNTALWEGGGVMFHPSYGVALLMNNIISHNTAVMGGGVKCTGSSPEITGNLILQNSVWSSYSGGGGILCENASPSIHGNFIMENTAGAGGGISCFNASPPINNNWIVDNTALDVGGGIYCYNSKSKITNNIIVGNDAALEGGGVQCVNKSSIKIRNSILWDNDAATGNEISLNLSASLYLSSMIVNHCDVEGGLASIYVHPSCTLDWGPGNLDADPLFVDPANNDFHLTYLSPCKDVGNNSAPGISTLDFEGDPRIAYGNVDMGADEFHPHLYYMGEAMPGGSIQVKCIGLPGTLVSAIVMGFNVFDPPLPSNYGLWYMDDPMLIIKGLGAIPGNGVTVFPGTVPASPPAPYTVYLQVVLNLSLTNLCPVYVE